MKVQLSNGMDHFYQWDIGQKIKIQLNVDTIHFKVSEDRAMVIPVKNGWANVPDELLRDGTKLTAWIYNSNHTVETVSIRVTPRAKPDGYTSSPSDAVTVEAIVDAAVTNALRQAKQDGDFKGDKGDTGQQGPKGDKGSAGAKGDTGPQGPKGDTGDKGDKGDKGEKGDAGISPTIGENGNWFYGGTDSGNPSRGAQGEKGDTGPQGPQGPQGPKGEAQGTTDHQELKNRDAADQHPMEAITGLMEALAQKVQVCIGASEPTNGPAIWFNTGANTSGGVSLLLNRDDSAVVQAEVNGETYGIENAGVNEKPTAGKYSFEII